VELQLLAAVLLLVQIQFEFEEYIKIAALERNIFFVLFLTFV